MSSKFAKTDPPEITYFICYKNYRKYLSRLRADQIGELHLALYDFAFDGVVREFDDLAVQLLYEILTDQIRRDTEQYVVKVENGRKGGRPRKDAEKPEKTSKTAPLSQKRRTPETEAKPKKTDNNQEEYEEEEEEKQEEEYKQDENYKQEAEYQEHPISSPQKEDIECSGNKSFGDIYTAYERDPDYEDRFNSLLDDLAPREQPVHAVSFGMTEQELDDLHSEEDLLYDCVTGRVNRKNPTYAFYDKLSQDVYGMPFDEFIASLPPEHRSGAFAKLSMERVSRRKE